jgi:hypothetical protein
LENELTIDIMKSWKAKGPTNTTSKTPSKAPKKVPPTTPGKPPRQRQKEKDPVEVGEHRPGCVGVMIK